MNYCAYCAYCGASYEPKRYNQAYCSQECYGARARERKREHYVKNRESILQSRRDYHAQNRDKIKNYYAQNREHKKKMVLEWFRKNPHRARLYSNRRRARLKEAGVYKVTTRDLERLMIRQRNECAACSGDLRVKPYDLDHIIPIAKGGSHSIGNLQWLCEDCNGSKTDHLPAFWRLVVKPLAYSK